MVDGAGNAYVAGSSNSPDFPGTPGSWRVLGAEPNDSFIARISGDERLMPVASVSAANYQGSPLAAGSIVSAFGVNLSTAVSAATALPLPTTLAGTTVSIRDPKGTEGPASLFFVSPAQVNYLLPAYLQPGLANVTITNGDGAFSLGTILVEAVRPGLFTANANGSGVAAALAQRVKPDNTSTYEPVARFDTAQNRYVPIPIDLGVEPDQVYLVLFGTGFRNRSSLEAVSVKVGGASVPVTYAGDQLQLAGLDQINARLPRSLVGRGDADIVVTVDGKTANAVRVSIK